MNVTTCLKLKSNIQRVKIPRPTNDRSNEFLEGEQRFNTLLLADNLVNRISSRVFLGDKLCRDEKVLSAIGGFKMSLFSNGIFWNFIALGPLRGAFNRLSAHAHKKTLQQATKLLTPTIEARMRARVSTADGEKVEGLDAIEWALDAYPPTAKLCSPSWLAQGLLHFMFVPGGSPGPTVTQMTYQVLVSPECLTPLRSDIEESLNRHGGWCLAALDDMPKLESFLREILRLYPPSPGTCLTRSHVQQTATCLTTNALLVACSGRISSRPFTFHDGYTLPIGAYVSFPIQAVQADADNYPDPLTFHPWRFLGDSGKSKPASTVDDKYLSCVSFPLASPPPAVRFLRLCPVCG